MKFWNTLLNSLTRVTKENEPLSKPVPSLISAYVEDIFKILLTLIGICLFVPWSPRTDCFNILWFLLAVLAYNLHKPKTSLKRAVRFWIIVPVLLAVLCFTPFLVAPKPLYVASFDSNNPFQSKVKYVHTDKSIIGSVWLLPSVDFLRSWIPAFLHKLFPTEIRLIQKSHHGDHTYYDIPILDSFTKDTQEKGDFVSKRSIFLPMTVFGKSIDLQSVPSNPFTYTTDHGNYRINFYDLKFDSLFNVTYVKYPELIPWNAVEVLNSQEDNTLIYIAYLDLGLEAILAGKSGLAIQSFEIGSTFAPAKNLEYARLEMLECLTIEENLQGNLGAFQSLPYLHKTYTFFKDSMGDPRFSKDDPLTNWIRQTLLAGYDSWDWTTAFCDRQRWLELLPHKDQTETSYFQDFFDKYKSTNGKTLLTLADDKDRSIAEIYVIRNILLDRIADQAMGSWNHLLTSTDSNAVLAWITNGPFLMRPIVTSINNSLKKKGAYDKEDVSVGMFDFVAIMAPKYIGTTNEQFLKLLESDANRSSIASQMASVNKALLGNDPSTILEGQKSDWWSTEYVSWFAYWSNDAFNTIDHFGQPWVIGRLKPQGIVSNYFKMYGPDCLVKDENGRGHLFIPGLYWLACYIQETEPNEANPWRNTFEDQTKLDLDMVRKSFYREANTEKVLNNN